jgi:hypothetical protein
MQELRPSPQGETGQAIEWQDKSPVDVNIEV